MNPAGIFGNSVGLFTVPWLTARETAALIVVVVSLLFFRVFRERCLLVWGAGWVAYGVFLWMARGGEVHATSKSDGGVRAGRLRAGDGAVSRSGADGGASAAHPGGGAGGLVGAHGVRRHASPLFSGFEDPRPGRGYGLPAACGRGIRSTAALPVRAYRGGTLPVWRRPADSESALASLYQPHSE